MAIFHALAAILSPAQLLSHTHKRSALLLAGILLTAALGWWFGMHGKLPKNANSTNPAVTRTLQLGLNLSADSALYAAATRFATLVGERSQGKIKIVVYPDQKLGNDDQMLEMARTGKLDLVLTPTAKLSTAIPAMQYADLPFYFSGRKELYEMLDGEPGQMLLSKLNALNLIGLTFWENGFKQFTSNRPIHKPQDFTGLRIRTMKSRLIADQFESLGAVAIPIDFHETYRALANGAVDGQENPLVAIVGMRFHEVQKHLTISNHAYLGYAFSASKPVFESLSPEMREIISETARELTAWEREETARRETQFIETIRAAGVQIHTLSVNERKLFQAKLSRISDRFGFDIGYDLLSKTDELRYATHDVHARPSGRTPHIFGFDADLSGSASFAGGSIYRGLQMAIEEINQTGGLLGGPVRLIARDHGASTQAGLANLEYFAAMDNLLAAVGGSQSWLISDELADIHRLKLPFLIPWAAGDNLTAHEYRPSFTFRVSIHDNQVMPFLLGHALKKGRPVGILLEQSAWGASNEAALRPLLAALPPGSAKIDWVYAGDPGLEARLSAIIASGAKSLIVVSNASRSRDIIRAMAAQEKPIPILSHWGITTTDFWRLEQESLRHVDLRFVQSILMEDAARNTRLKKFIDRYRTRYGLDSNAPIPSMTGSVQAYDLMQLLSLAVKKANSPNRAAIRGALESLPPYDGIMRRYSPPFTPTRHDALDGQPLHLARYDEKGRIVRAD